MDASATTAPSINASGRLTAVTEDVWVARQPHRFYGINVGARMTVIRLRDGSVWIHSPIRLDDELAAAIAELGPVRHIVAPNNLHHLFAGEAHRRFPTATLHVAPGLLAKRPDLAGKAVLGAAPSWGTEILVHEVAGLRVLGEWVFFHAPSRSLVVCDLGFNFGSTAPWATRQFARAFGVYGRFGCPLDLRWFFLVDKREFGRSITTIRTWDFERIILAHGDLVTEAATTAFERAFAFLGAAVAELDA